MTTNGQTHSWIRSPFWDFFWFHSGLWLTVLLLLVKHSGAQEIFYASGVFLFWIGHRLTSLYLAWGTQAYKPLLRKQRVRFVLFPAFLTIIVFALLLAPENVLPFSLSVRILVPVLIDYIWGIHHFAAQHYGLLRLYHHRGNPDSAPLAQKADRRFCWGVGGAMILIAEILHGTSLLQDEGLLPLFSHEWSGGISSLPGFSTFLVVVITLFMLGQAWLQDSGLPRILYLSGVGVMAVAAFQLSPFQFLMLWTLQHWMAALGLAAHMGGNDALAKSKENLNFPAKSKFFNFAKHWQVLLCLCVFSVLLTPFLEIEAVFAGGRYSEQVVPSLVMWLQNSQWTPFLVGIGFASGFVHYWMDRAVYRFSDLETRNSAQQLLRTR